MPDLSFASDHAQNPFACTRFGKPLRSMRRDRSRYEARGRDRPRRRRSQPPATRISLRPHDPTTGEEVEKEEVVKGYEYRRGQFVTFTPKELKALDIESSKFARIGLGNQ
jgi:hypothetical protein